MSTLKNIFFLALCLLIGLGIGNAYVSCQRHATNHNMEKHEGPPQVTGIGDAPANRGFAVQPSDVAVLPDILKQSESLFATSLAVEHSPALTPDALTNAVKEAHRRQFRVILLPPAKFSAENPYPRPLPEIAAEAQAAQVDILCISWLNADPDPAYWKSQADAVRKVFAGRIILAATPDVMPFVGCWEVADFLGAIGPIAIPRRLSQAPTDLTVHDLRVAWDSSLSSMESLARVNSKPLALLHMNIPIDAKTPPGIQQLAYEALLLETKGRAQVTEILLFNWSAQSDAPSPHRLPQLLPKISNAWDPKTPRLPDQPATQVGP